MALSGSIDLDQFVAAPPHVVWTLLTDPGHHARWWAPGDISAEVGHRFHLAMPGFGEVPCVVLESEQDKRLSYSFNGNWTITWTLTPVAGGTTLHLTHSGFDLDDHRQRDAHDRMSPGWRDTVLPRLAAVAESL
ncbi:polyketide cyclase [Actinokineospora bangkokensis]|uniref:Polyketide cyclase n=1 Tax=Actinokineospora bangkokensis TaxID=1193682 RepID=A0A1Q9LM56_9PSEU|nr:polyketide cyclase [Actinokineospora bangkokensis]